ncbi:MAG: murein biosynthesis integral membrane protein MurJ [Rickettsiales bacterium]|jgi:putative peptidoglycan lipid II flippase|nr:murein biosynthesis integral membrane protein MurJ [Rickettsiales bacterium]
MKLGKHIFSVGAMTGVSRVFGFIRDVLIARYLGAGRLSDIFLAAFKLPNLFRDLLGEGALSSIFIPMFADQKKDKHFADNVFSWLMVVLLGITLVCQIFMPLIVWILAPGFFEDPGKMEMTVLVSRIMFFYVIFVCGAAFLSAVLNAFTRFALAAFMPVLLNIILIGALMAAGRFAGETLLFILAGTVVLSGIVQMGVLWSRIRRGNFGLRLIVPKWTPRIKQLLKRMGIGIFGSGFYQITIIIGTLVASFQSGAVSWLYYSDRIVQLPFAVIGLAAGTVLLSSISNAMADGNMRSVHIQQNSSMRQSLMLIIPSVVGLLVLARPIIKYLFEYGAWTPESTNAVAMAIMIQVLALPAMLISNIYGKTLYAAQDVRTPVMTSVVSLIVACVIYLGLFRFVGYLAIPIGIVASGYLKNYMLARECKKRGLFKIEPRTIRAVAAFGAWAMVLGAGLLFAPISSIWTLGAAMAGYGILYLPAAMLINKKI